MSFETDKQTLEDLNILGKFNSNCSRDIFFVRNYKLISIRFFTFNVIIFVFVKT